MRKCMQKCPYNTDAGCIANTLVEECTLSNTADKEQNEAGQVNKELVKMVKNVLLDVVRKVNSGQLVEVVRCHDCKNWDRLIGIFDSPNGYCYIHEETVNGNDYCSYGERRKP